MLKKCPSEPGVTFRCEVERDTRRRRPNVGGNEDGCKKEDKFGGDVESEEAGVQSIPDDDNDDKDVNDGKGEMRGIERVRGMRRGVAGVVV